MTPCHACQCDYSPRETEGLPGLCPSCTRRSKGVGHELSKLLPGHFEDGIAIDPNAEPPRWRPRGVCNRCGVVGHLYTWNRWRFLESGDPAREERWVEGDGYSYCTNCRDITTSPWSPLTPSVELPRRNDLTLPAVSMRAARRTGGPGLVLIELVILISLTVTVTVLLL